MYLGMSGMAGVRPAQGASYGSAASYASGANVGGAFGSGMTSPMPSTAQILAPNDGFGLACTLGLAAIVLLCFIRYSLPR